MDRFIEVRFLYHRLQRADLKSNMDRFIANLLLHFLIILETNLKSNMDRFIVYTYDSITIKNFI